MAYWQSAKKQDNNANVWVILWVVEVFAIGHTAFTAHHPTLDKYAFYVPRVCNPIYPKDAAMIMGPEARILGQKLLQDLPE
ncbi:hypothetical protein BC936DRAFT_138926 [Jimgerdemannia flammicorona]|uniref:Uncharacterized protein n=1 Tax=Jimgerdemannia flammicorona TaxID=994334 RepID=A0A433DI15_9FUNG|nr:hypothetical protein BC936DRAFT_138926 [Jimgerdemannia flammicorona]